MRLCVVVDADLDRLRIFNCKIWKELERLLESFVNLLSLVRNTDGFVINMVMIEKWRRGLVR